MGLILIFFLYFIMAANCACPEIVNRTDWGAIPANGITSLPTKSARFVVVHHSDTSSCSGTTDCALKLKSIQSYHMGKGWDDIGYNFLIGGDGTIFEGRGWGITGAHAKGWNSKSIGICLLGNYQDTQPPQAQTNALESLIKCSVEKKFLPEDYHLVGHRQVVQTDCPGNKLYNIVKSMSRITDNILAMARPSSMVISYKHVLQQFEAFGIKSIINLQCPKEHASCGQPLESSGFSYDPNVFMEQNIYYYNFAWKDYGDATLEGLLNMVKVIAFALTEGRVAIHCHAGLGRTGVLIACYLVFSLRVSANDAIRFVRLKRPGSVQTRGQILCVRHFAQCILPQSITYYIKENVSKDKYMNEFSLHRALRRQRVVLHGYEERNFKYLPKIVYVIGERLLKLCGCNDSESLVQPNRSFTADYLTEKLFGHIKKHESTYSIASLTSPSSEMIFLKSPNKSPTSPSPNCQDDPSDTFSEISTLDGEELNEELLLENKCFQELETEKTFKDLHEDIVVHDIHEIIHALLSDLESLDIEIRRKVRQYQNEINTSKLGWMRLSVESNVYILASLLFEWLEGLKSPVLQLDHFEFIVVGYKQPEECFQKLGLEEAYLVEYILKFLSRLHIISKETLHNVLKRFIASLSKHTISIDSHNIPSGKGFKRLGDGTLGCTMQFLQSMLEIVDYHHKLKTPSFSSEKASEIESDIEIGFQ